jgi:hypothetical protein
MKKKNCNVIIIITLSFFFDFCNNYENEFKNLDVIINNENYIKKYCKEFNIPIDVFKSVILAELELNYNYYDELDEFRARIGLNPSIGVCQIKISTCQWIEQNSTNILITKSTSLDDLIDKMILPKYNILYACNYLNIINERYYECFNKFPNLKILASYYGCGVDNNIPLNPEYYNILGEKAVIIYNTLFK